MVVWCDDVCMAAGCVVGGSVVLFWFVCCFSCFCEVVVSLM